MEYSAAIQYDIDNDKREILPEYISPGSGNYPLSIISQNDDLKLEKMPYEELSNNQSLDIQMIPIDSVHVLNPRSRNKKKYSEIVSNISDVGLKRPITVCRNLEGGYDLVCGQGRLEALSRLGQTMIPAIIRDISTEDALLMSLVENIARRKPTTMETIRQLAILRDRGYSKPEIAKKTGIQEIHVYELLHLYDHGEQRLLAAVQTGRISVSSAIIIARSEYCDVQHSLLEAFEQGSIQHSELTKARVIADSRKAFGKECQSGTSKPITGDSIVRVFKREQQKQLQSLKKAELCEKRLIFAINALRMLFRDENFINLIKAEGLDTVPDYIALNIKERE
ncbi:MAG: ParB/RepB/Spo0J family partition protein [Armatimonadota bacterium]